MAHKTNLCSHHHQSQDGERDLKAGKGPSLEAITTSSPGTIIATNGCPCLNTRAHGLPCARKGKQEHNCKNKPWGKIYSVFLSSVRLGKKIFSCQNTSRAPICVFIKYREEHTGKERLETFPLHSACGPGSLTRDHTLRLEVK